MPNPTSDEPTSTEAADLTTLRTHLQQGTYTAEVEVIDRVLRRDQRTDGQIQAAQTLAIRLIEACRDQREERSLLDAFLDQFGLSTEEGVALMCLAESIVRVPDTETADALIADKLGSGTWREHLGQSDSLLVNASTWALMLTGEVVELGQPLQRNFGSWFGKLVNRMGEPIIRQSLRYAMQLLGSEFVFAATAAEAIDKATQEPANLFSFDMLGEAARTEADAKQYHAAYTQALAALEQLPANPTDTSFERSGISVKLSALYPRYETHHANAVQQILYPRLLQLAEQAAAMDVQLTIDAEEANRLDLSLDLLARLCAEPNLRSWQGLGLAVQAYGRRALPLLDWLAALAARHDRRLIVRLVKGAYWDSEIKLAQQQGVPSYPVFTTKPATDLSYLACAQQLLDKPAAFFPQFATHNAHTWANVMTLAGNAEYEMQRLHGMGELLYTQGAQILESPPKVRTYAPVGPHKHLMAYLIRRLLENGANSSFVNRFLDEDVSVSQLVRNNRSLVFNAPPLVPNPPDLYQPLRLNSAGLELQDPMQLTEISQALAQYEHRQWQTDNAEEQTSKSTVTVVNPANVNDVVGCYVNTTPEDVVQLVSRANAAFPAWNATPPKTRADLLRRTANLFERHRAELMALLIREAGKTWEDALDEVREAVDFCRFYGAECERLFNPEALPGPTGESNQLQLLGRGAFVCISPWNFPLAIFTGQIAAALAAGNTVVAKPAEQTTLIAERALQLLWQAGIPPDAAIGAPGDSAVGATLVSQPDIAGVAFTGSTAVAKSIQLSLTKNIAEIVPFIAETGGQNVMLVDSTAMPEQVVDDALRSAFGSAGQRCSALRVLCVQDDIADDLVTMLSGAMDMLVVDNPWQVSTDIGPIIDASAQEALQSHIDNMSDRIIHQTQTVGSVTGHFILPTLIELDSIAQLTQEHFGPVLHVRRYSREKLDELIEEINATGYGLTLGIHSRNSSFVDRITQAVRAGNVYVNRNMIGAVVGVQPFGGRGLSGSGPKAGGPNYVARFAAERTLTNNVAAIGGNLELLTGAGRAET